MAMPAAVKTQAADVTEDVLTLQRDGVVGKKGAFSREFI